MHRGDDRTSADELGHAEELIDSDPKAAKRLAESYADSSDTAVAFRARRVAAMAARELQDIEGSTGYFEAALEVVEPGSREAALTSLSLAGNAGLAGRVGDAHRILDELDALDALGDDGHLIAIQRATMYLIEDNLGDAVAVFEDLLSTKPDLGDSMHAHVLGNLGSALVQLGRFDEGRRNLGQALSLYQDSGEQRPQLDVLSNLALCEAWSLNIPRALALFERANELAASLGVVDGIAGLDKARALVEAGLGNEALAAATEALDVFDGGGTAAWLGEAHLVQALALLIADRPQDAAQAANRAREEFERQGRSTSALFADKTQWIAAMTVAGFDDFDGALRAADGLVAHGYSIDAQELRARTAVTAFDANARPIAGAAARLAATGPNTTPAARVRASLARGVELLVNEAVSEAQVALEEGIAELERHRLTLGATELRARSSSLGLDLARLALWAAFHENDHAGIWRWSERTRANTLGLRPDPGARDPDVVAALAALRRVSAAARTGGDSRDVEEQQRRVTTLLRSRVASPDATTDTVPEPLNDSQTFIEVDGWLHRLDVDSHGGLRLFERIIRVDDLTEHIEAVRIAWRRWLRHREHSTESDVLASLTSGLLTLDEALQNEVTMDGQVLIVSESLHGVPWSALPSRSSTRLSVVPTASVLTGSHQERTDGAVIVAGPRLVHADDEVRAVAALWPGAAVYGSDESVAEDVIAQLSGCRVAHIAAHGTFREDNPMFSSLEMADGPLTVIDLERLHSPPEVTVLSACDAGSSAVFHGNETLGLVAALLAVGCRSVIAPVLPVADVDCKALMVELHRRLAAGSVPSLALRDACHAFEYGSHEAMLAASFVCFGQG